MGKTKISDIFTSGKAALLVIDMQGDYCEYGYYMDKAGYDIDRLRQPIPHITRVVAASRQTGVPVIYTRQYRTKNKNELAKVEGSFPNTSLLGEPGWEIIPELKPQPKDIILDKTTCSVFASTDIDKLLKDKGITYLIFCGNTIDVCVHSSLRSANDLGYKCITLADCCGAVNDNLYKWSLESIQVEDGVFGSVITASELIATLQ